MSATTIDSGTEIRLFQIEVPEEELAELRRRIAATRWPEKETVADQTQGVQLATIQELARYWGTEYDFGRVEARLNAFPQFVTEIDGLDIHFIHVRSPHENALPILITHVKGVTVPAAVTVFPNELYQAPRSWTEKAYPNLIYFNEVDEGNDFAAWQEPELFTTEIRAAFRSLR